MEIRSKSHPSPVDSYISQVQAKSKIEPPADGPLRQAPKTDTVVISETAKRVQDAKAQLDSIPDVRSDKVAEIKSRIENGTYEIQADKIADKMIRESLLNDFYK
jgi:negative regulator of flagellin synthesis FlgM